MSPHTVLNNFTASDIADKPLWYQWELWIIQDGRHDGGLKQKQKKKKKKKKILYNVPAYHISIFLPSSVSGQ